MRKYNVLQIIWFIVLLIVFGLLCTLGFIYKNKVSNYKEYETKLVNASKEYLKDKSLFPKEGKTKKINIKTLINKGYVEKKEVIKECSGNIIVSHDKTMEYTPNLKCNYYKSK